MLKKLMLGVFVIFVILAALIGFALYRANDIVASFQPALEQKLSAALGTPVSLGTLSVSLYPPIAVSAQNVRFGGKEKSDHSLSLRSISARMAILAILNKRIEISDLTLKGPEITIVKEGDNTYIEGLKHASRDSNTSVASPRSDQTAPMRKEGEDLVVDIEKISVSEGKVHIFNRNSKSELTLNDVDLNLGLATKGNAVTISGLNLVGYLPDKAPFKVSADSVEDNRVSSLTNIHNGAITFAGSTVSLNGTYGDQGLLTFVSDEFDLNKSLVVASSFLPQLQRYINIPLEVKRLKGSFRPGSKEIRIETVAVQTAGGLVTGSGELGGDQKGTFTIESDGLDLGKLLPSLSDLVPAVKQYPVSGKAVPKLQLRLSPAEAAQSYAIDGPIVLTDVSVTGPNNLAFEKIHGPISLRASPGNTTVTTDGLGAVSKGEELKITATMRVERGDVAFPILNIQGFGGSITAPMQPLPGEHRPVKLKPAVRTVSLERLLNVVKPDLANRISGQLVTTDADLSMLLAGNVTQSMRGPGQVLLQNGMLKGFNVAAAALQRVDSLPFLQGSLAAHVPKQYQALLNNPDTPIKDMRARFSLDNGVLHFESFTAVSDIFTLESRGQIGMLDGMLDLDASISFTPEFSESLAGSIKELRRIFTSQGTLTFPLSIHGISPKLIVTPDLKKILELGAKRVIKDQALDAIGRAIGKDSAQAEGVKKTLEGILGF